MHPRAVPRWGVGDGKLGLEELPVRLHDVATGLAIGIGLLKGRGDRGEAGLATGVRALALVEDSLAELRKLIAATSGGSIRRRSGPSLAESIKQEAQLLKIRLELDVRGNEYWLAPNHTDLILLVGREGLRNVSRHAGTAACQIAIELTTCPFEMTVRDWGAGVTATEAVGSGIRMLKEMATGMGCDLAVASKPGLGAELVLVGPPCAKDRIREPRDQPALSGRQPTQNGRQEAVKSAGEEAD